MTVTFPADDMTAPGDYKTNYKLGSYVNTVEPRYNEVLGTMEITLIYQGEKNKCKELGLAKSPC